MGDDYEMDTGDWEPPRKNPGLPILLSLLGVILVILCTGLVWSAWNRIAKIPLGQADVVESDSQALVVPDYDCKVWEVTNEHLPRGCFLVCVQTDLHQQHAVTLPVGCVGDVGVEIR